MSQNPLQVAYFSMEFAFDKDIPNYAGGLGVLAADMMYSLADMKIPAVGMSLIYHQNDDPNAEDFFDSSQFMTRMDQVVEVTIEDRQVKVGVYRYDVKGISGYEVPVYFLSTYLPDNQPWDRDITKWLYASEQYYRIAQEAILGIGGLKMLRALGYENIDALHMNEGHSAFLTFERLRETDYDDAQVRANCTFTTHTPVKAGHDYFEYPLVRQILGDQIPWHIEKLATESKLSMTHLALNMSKVSNSVSKRHQRVCQEMFPNFSFENITNGIYHNRWVSDRMGELYDEYLPGWRNDPGVLQHAPEKLSSDLVWSANQRNKREFVDWINSNQENFSYWDDMYPEDFFDEETLTICFARRFVEYKRPGLIFRFLDRFRQIGFRKVQLVFGGRCHPHDQFCNLHIGNLKKDAERLRGQVRVAVIPEYNIDIAHKMVGGSDIWLNNPIIPYEASGTSGMKAALNAGLNLSILDGWWQEGFQMAPKAGWGFGLEQEDLEGEEQDDADALAMYDQLTDAVDCYYNRQDEWRQRMLAAISLVGHFNTNRAVGEYLQKMWKGKRQ